jgi:asparagine synthetase B (glutamine-hydrolysing)
MELPRPMMDPALATIAGDATCSEPRYFSIIDGAPIASSDIAPILYARHRSGAGTALNHTAISHLLHDGFVPQPSTVYKDIYVVSMGVIATIANGVPDFQFDFPFTGVKSRQDSQADVETLLMMLAEATARACSTGSDRILMLSAGLDSTSLALAAKEAGQSDILCVTYAEDDDLEESHLARRLCARLGLRHETYVREPASAAIRHVLQQYSGSVPEPCADPALIACVAPISHYARKGTVVLDGTGSDAYFWNPPRLMDLAKLYVGWNRLRLVTRMRSLLPMHLRYERLLSSPLEVVMFSGPRLRYCDTRAFYPAAVDTHSLWLAEYGRLAFPMDEVRASTRSIFVGPAAHMMKTRNAATFVGALARFPWADPAVADYCFHLPEEHRFSRRPSRNKLIVREMLRKLIDYDDRRIGKRVFKFGKDRFIARHMDFCRDEILSCSLWSRGIEPVFDRLAKGFRGGRQTENALLSLLMISLWHNHWVGGRLSAIERPTSSVGVAA